MIKDNNLRKLIDYKSPAYNTQYKTVGVQWFARVWFSLQLFPWWIQTQPENPTVSYCKTLPTILEKVANDTNLV